VRREEDGEGNMRRGQEEGGRRGYEIFDDECNDKQQTLSFGGLN
jgi:hypothetical protein